ncbi:glutamyl-tRNA synthetase /glutamate--tRNA(Gln) ligase [Ectothiorhodosinus mongolicus]|uniref:Glutamate--tRNA ligase n=2 Tax=Ectothiorhodosinus mongolicus TaxID=233100 RepID=A0A1R3W6T0_9GAMM|nr:glutamyl-tRNA synthetase /glutamate--tRNA(Gln) ligase [Ectothiorhodosinus mongolicus]
MKVIGGTIIAVGCRFAKSLLVTDAVLRLNCRAMSSLPAKSRFAPSPTGWLHLGNLRTALFSALMAWRHGGHFLLRVEDTDAERSEQAFTEALYEDLHWLGLDWQEGPGIGGAQGPYLQSERAEIYQRFYDELEAKGLAYPCFCSAQALKLSRKAQLTSGQPPRYAGTCAHLSSDEVQRRRDQGIEPTLRFRVPPGKEVRFTDLVRGEQVYRSEDIGDFVIRRSDGTPAFFFSNAIDDALMGVTHVLRGEDHLTNTPRQLMLLEALGLPTPSYAHISLILGSDGGPLSKRAGALSLRALREQGYLPIAILNHLARLGHVYERDDLLPLDDLIGDFDVARLGRAPARHDPTQLDHWQRLAVNHADDAVLLGWLDDQDVSAEQAQQLVAAVRDNVQFPADLRAWAQRLLKGLPEFDADGQALLRAAGADFFQQALQVLDSAPDDFKAFAQAVGERSGARGKALFQPLRLALSGVMFGPEMHRIWTLLGPAACRARLEHAAVIAAFSSQ